MSGRTIESVAVFCGSNFGGSAVFAEGAAALGRVLAEAGITLVYGGTIKGLMGVVADAALAAGGRVHGVITDRLHQRGHSHAGLTLHEVVETLRERKARMAQLADAFVALPGGIGTLEETLEVWTMNQLGEIDKPVGLLNLDGFYDPFMSFIDHMVATAFLPAAHRHSIVVEPDPLRLIRQMVTMERVTVPKWL